MGAVRTRASEFCGLLTVSMRRHFVFDDAGRQQSFAERTGRCFLARRNCALL
jgi:hypothetical protein